MKYKKNDVVLLQNKHKNFSATLCNVGDFEDFNALVEGIAQKHNATLQVFTVKNLEDSLNTAKLCIKEYKSKKKEK